MEYTAADPNGEIAVSVPGLRFAPSVALVLVLLLGLASGALGQTVDVRAVESDRDAEILRRGLYDTGEIVGGGLLGTLIGFGTGHAAQDRWRDTGWIYTTGESVSFLGALIGGAACPNGGDDDDKLFPDNIECVVTVFAVGGGVFLGFRIAEMIDVWAHPQIHNRRFREIEAERARRALRWSPYVIPNEAGGASFGVALRF